MFEFLVNLSAQYLNFYREVIEKARAAIKDGRSSDVTKKNPALLSAEETINQVTYDLNSAEAAVSFIACLV